MRRLVTISIAALALAGCGRHDMNVGPTPTPLPSTGQSFNLFTHCGILTTTIAGRTFYLAELSPARVPVVGNPVESGTITMITPHLAEFTDASGNHIRFIDQPPGKLNHPYPFTVHVIDGGNRLIDEPFAGRWWRTSDTLPGVVGPPYGNGQDRYTTVKGTFTLTSENQAVFKSDAGAIARFTVRQPTGCD